LVQVKGDLKPQKGIALKRRGEKVFTEEQKRGTPDQAGKKLAIKEISLTCASKIKHALPRPSVKENSLKKKKPRDGGGVLKKKKKGKEHRK